MPKAIHGHNMPASFPLCPATQAGLSLPPRRHLLAGLGAALAAGAVAVVPVPAGAEPADADAALLALHRRFLAHHAVVEAWNAGRVTEAVGEPAHDAWWDCVDALIETRAATLPGIKAKSEVALLAFEMAGGNGGPDEELVRSALRDVLALAPGAAGRAA